MRAAVHSRYGPPDVVTVADVEVPTPARDELLVRVRATTVNRTDCAYRAGTPFVARFVSGVPHPRAKVWGTEFAGVVEAVGDDVTKFVVGERVFGYVEGTFGAHAEQLVVSQDASVASIPDGVDFAHAAAATEGAHYALAFVKHSGLGRGQRVLVNGATGAIGSAAVQLAVSIGATVTAVTDTDHVELVRGLGAARVVDHLAEDFTRDRERYDAVFDTVGKSTFGACRRLLVPGGVYLSSELGPGWQNPLLAVVTPALRRTPLLGGRRVAFPYPTHDQEMIRHLAGLLDRRELRPVLDRTYALGSVVDAYRYVETGRKVGSVVIDVGGGPIAGACRGP